MAANASSSGRHNLRRAGKQNQHQFIVDPETLKDDMKPFSMMSSSEKGKNKAKTQSVSLADVEKQKIALLRKITSLDEVVGVDRRWTVSHDAPLRITELKPQRIPLKSRRTKRCNGCRHILIKPDPKASTKYRIRFLASTYVPAVTVHRRIPASLGGRISASSSAATAKTGRVSSVTGAPKTSSNTLQDTLIPLDASTLETSEPLRPGRNYSYTLTLANPLYEVIQVQISIIDPSSSPSAEEEEVLQQDRQHWTASLPCPSFDIGPFAEDWEYENDLSDNEDGSPSNGKSRKKRYPPGMLAKKANKTVVLMDLATGREAAGNVKVHLRVDYTYTAEEAVPETAAKTPSQGDKAVNTAGSEATASKSDVKTFSFTTSMVLGRVVPRPTAAAIGAGAGTSGLLDVQQARRVPSSSDIKGGSGGYDVTAASSN